MEDGWRREQTVKEMETYELNSIVLVDLGQNVYYQLLQDGQQRIITFCLLLAVLRDELERTAGQRHSRSCHVIITTPRLHHHATSSSAKSFKACKKPRVRYSV
jgi:uncharacterized protein with ParB-like and HNH nuclease domain